MHISRQENNRQIEEHPGKAYNAIMDNNLPFDTQAEEYDRWFDQPDGKIIFVSELKAIQEVLIALPPPWLEVGVGSGRFAQALGITTGLDPSGQLLEIARSRGILTLKGRIENHPLPQESFGSVFLIMTLCFLEKPAIALKEINSALKSSGKLVVGDVPADSTWGRLYLEKKLHGHPFYKHANFYTYQELKGMLKQAGFKIYTTISTLLQKPGQITEIESPLNGYHKEAGFIVVSASRIKTPD